MKGVTPEQVNELVRKGSLSLYDILNVVTFDNEGSIVSKELVCDVSREYVDTGVLSVNEYVPENMFILRYYRDGVGSAISGIINPKSKRWVA